MKICLISPPTATEFDDPELARSDRARQLAEQAPLGVLSLAAVLEQANYVVSVVDLNFLYYQFLDGVGSAGADFSPFALEHIRAADADVYGFGSICSTYPLTLRLLSGLRRSGLNRPILLGGPQASVVDVPTLENFPEADIVVRGEAEQTLPALLQRLASNADIDGLPGITYRQGKQVRRSPNAAPIHNLDHLPLPAFHLLPHYRPTQFVPLELGRGCPFACEFCSTNDFFRRQYRLKSPETMISQMGTLADTFGIGSFDLVHDMFTVDRKRVVAFCEALLRADRRFGWACSARTDFVDQRLLELMAKAGCTSVFFGVETGSQRLQHLIGKDLDVVDARASIKHAVSNGLSATVSLITGFPDETRADLAETVGFFLESSRHSAAKPQLHLLAPLADTPLHRRHRSELYLDGVFSDMSQHGWNQHPADRVLIASYPELFPDFYALPTVLPRPYLQDLIHFLTHAVRRVRLIMLAIYQTGSDFLSYFDAWREWKSSQSDHRQREGARYYSQPAFVDELLQFTREWLDTVRYFAAHVLVEFEVARRSGKSSFMFDYDVGKVIECVSEAKPPVPQQPRSRMLSVEKRGKQVYIWELNTAPLAPNPPIPEQTA